MKENFIKMRQPPVEYPALLKARTSSPGVKPEKKLRKRYAPNLAPVLGSKTSMRY